MMSYKKGSGWYVVMAEDKDIQGGNLLVHFQHHLR